MSIIIIHNSNKLIEKTNSKITNLPWLALKAQGASHKQYQYIIIFIITLVYIILVYWASTNNIKPVIIGSLLGALPVLLFELNREIKSHT